MLVNSDDRMIPYIILFNNSPLPNPEWFYYGNNVYGEIFYLLLVYVNVFVGVYFL